eukprot:5859990-Prymnesium_polylepis.1
MRRGRSAAARAPGRQRLTPLAAWGFAAGRVRRLVADWCWRKSSHAGWVGGHVGSCQGRKHCSGR